MGRMMAFARTLASFGAVLLMAIGGCGPSAGTPATLSATLELTNCSESTQQVDLDGLVVATIRPGVRQRLRQLQSGVRNISWTPLGADGRLRVAARQEGRVDLDNGSVTAFEIEGGLAPPPRFGIVRVVNQVLVPMQVSVDDRVLGQVLAGDTRVFSDIQSGEIALVASDRLGVVALATSVTLDPDGTTVWTLSAPTESLVVVNDTTEAVRLTLNPSGPHPAGEASLRLEPGATHRFEALPIGPHRLTARSTGRGARYETRIILQAGFPERWSLSADRAVLTVVNRTAHHLTLSGLPAGGRTEVPLEPGQPLRLEDLTPGTLALKVRDTEGLFARDYSIILGSGHERQWDIHGASDTVSVQNRTPWPLVVAVDGKRVTSVAPEAYIVVPMPGQAISVQALDRDFEMRRTADSFPPNSGIWVVAPPTGSLAVENRWDETVTVTTDGRPMGRVDAGQTVIFTHLPQGVQRARWAGDRTGTIGDADVTIGGAAPTPVIIRRALGQLSIENQTDEPIRIPPASGRASVTIQPGERHQIALPAGPNPLSLIGARSGATYFERVEISPDRVANWTLRPIVGVVSIVNRLAVPIRVSIGAETPVLLAPKAEHLWSDIPAGIHRLRAEEVPTARFHEVERRVSPDLAIRWAVVLEPARIAVFNPLKESVALYIGASRYGTVAAGGRQIFGALPEGRQDLSLVGTRTGVRHSVSLTLTAGEVQSVSVPEASATVRVENGRGTLIHVQLGDAAPVPVQPGSVVAFAAVAGSLLMVVEGESDRVVRPLTLTAGARQSVVIGPPRARIIVANRRVTAYEISVDGVVVGSVAPGASLTLEAIRPGMHTLRAVQEGAAAETAGASKDQPAPVIMERRMFHGGTQPWVLPAAPAAAPGAEPESD